MAAGNKPVWVQVAEAGFGERLEELGWKRVSPAHWRLDGDGVIWRTLLDKPSESEMHLEGPMDGCFVDETGFELAGLDDLIKRVRPDDRYRWLHPMIRRSVRVHMATSIGSEFYDRSYRRCRESWEANRASKSTIRRLLFGVDPLPPIERLYDVEPAYRTTEEHLRSTGFVEGWWDTTELGVEEVSARLARYWEELVKPEVDRWLTARDALAMKKFTWEDPDTDRYDLLDVYAHYIAGDPDYCRRRLRAVVNQKIPTVEEKLEWLRKVKFFKRVHYRKYTEEDKRKTAIEFIQTAEFVVRRTKRVAEALDLKLE